MGITLWNKSITITLLDVHTTLQILNNNGEISGAIHYLANRKQKKAAGHLSLVDGFLLFADRMG
jgi:hypothetical protein